jgi:hypothetical protein
MQNDYYESYCAVLARAALDHRGMNGASSVANFIREAEEAAERYALKATDVSQRQAITAKCASATEIARRDNAVTMNVLTGA